jgi:ferredoxin, 2Fe-2S
MVQGLPAHAPPNDTGRRSNRLRPERWKHVAGSKGRAAGKIQFPECFKQWSSEMPVVTFKPSGKTIEVAEGSTILEAILSAGEKFTHKCEGQATCGTCHIYVPEGRKTLTKIQRLENEKLDTIVGVATPSRLACQARLGTENITVEILSFI